MKPSRHCHHCGCEWTLAGQPGRSETCRQCSAELRVCLNCVSYDPRAAHHCRDQRADPVDDPDRGNFCEYFAFVQRVYAPAAPNVNREQVARYQLKKLFG